MNVLCKYVLAAVLMGPSPMILHAQTPQGILARVNGQPILAAEMELAKAAGQLPAAASPAQQAELLEQLIDRELIRAFLKSRNLTPTADQIAEQVGLVRAAITQRGGKPEEVLARLKLDEKTLENLLAVSAGWDLYMKSVVTEEQIRSEWNSRRQELDGTRVQAAQIIRLLPADAPVEKVNEELARLAEVKQKITDGKLTFAAAAGEFSQSPSAAKGGDLGEIEYRGRVDEEISRVAFSLKPGEVSAPFRSRRGVHLVQVSQRIPGQLSAEDARPEILSSLSKKLWAETCQQSRKTTRIERL